MRRTIISKLTLVHFQHPIPEVSAFVFISWLPSSLLLLLCSDDEVKVSICKFLEGCSVAEEAVDIEDVEVGNGGYACGIEVLSFLGEPFGGNIIDQDRIARLWEDSVDNNERWEVSSPSKDLRCVAAGGSPSTASYLVTVPLR